MSSPEATVAVRALNYMRGVHLPSYVALRFLLGNLPPVELSMALTSLVERLANSKIHRIYSVKRFKCFNNYGAPEYRSYSVPSPTHALAEAYSLYYLQEAGLRNKPKYIYSYRTPKTSSYQKNYEQFSLGYSKRNSDVLSALGDNQVALVFDLRKFYPSINAEKVVGDFISLLATTDISIGCRRVIEKCAMACVEPTRIDGKRGLRVGPDMSHTLADYALKELDEKISNKYPNRYFRYVDDLVIVVDGIEAEDSQAEIRAIVQACGFALNDEKQAIASKQIWAGYRNRFLPQNGEFDPLSSFRFRLKVFLARKPDSKIELSDELTNIGVFLPIDSLMEATASVSWRNNVLRFFRAGWKQLFAYRLDTVDSIVRNAELCQKILREHIAGMLADGISSVPLTRRWQVQQARFLMNRALYFLPRDELEQLIEFMKNIPELDETSAVARAIARLDFSAIAVMPGPVASTAAHLASVRGFSSDVVFPGSLNSGDPFVAADIAAHFAIRGFESRSSFDGVSDDSGALLRFSFAESIVSGISSITSYGQEIEWLGLGWDKHARVSAAASRLFQDEEIVLEALSLSSAYAS